MAHFPRLPQTRIVSILLDMKTHHSTHKAEAESQAAEELPAAPAPAAVHPERVRAAVAHNEPLAALTALSVLHGHAHVTEHVKKHADDPNYGANARAWLTHVA